MFSPSIIEVNCSAVSRNVDVLRSIVGPGCGVCAVVKANAYGLGTARMGRALDGAGVDMIAVFAPDEAETLIASDVNCPILVLMAVRSFRRADELYRAAVLGRLHLVVHGREHARTLAALASSLDLILNVHIEVDTGLGRGGVRPAEAIDLLDLVHDCEHLRLTGVMTHFARAETDVSYTAEQLARFDQFLVDAGSLIPDDVCVHAANTFATLRQHRFHKHMVRVGLGWAGYGSETLETSSWNPLAARLQPLVRWTSQIVHTKTIEAGDSIGYGSRWTAARRTLLGLIPVGYADGYPMGMASRDGEKKAACVGVCAVGEDVARTYAPVVGTISMDQMMIDLTDVAACESFTQHPPGVGTVVELISDNRLAPNHLPSLAASAGARSHDVLCHLSPRSQYVYTGRASMIEVDPVAFGGSSDAAAKGGDEPMMSP